MFCLMLFDVIKTPLVLDWLF